MWGCSSFPPSSTRRSLPALCRFGCTAKQQDSRTKLRKPERSTWCKRKATYGRPVFPRAPLATTSGNRQLKSSGGETWNVNPQDPEAFPHCLAPHALSRSHLAVCRYHSTVTPAAFQPHSYNTRFRVAQFAPSLGRVCEHQFKSDYHALQANYAFPVQISLKITTNCHWW